MARVGGRFALAARSGAMLLFLLVTLLGVPATARPAQADGQKLALAFYYMWYGPNSFTSGLNGDMPLTNYISDHSDTIQRQVQQAKASGLDGFIVSWWGRDDITDKNMGMLLDQAGADFSASIYFETGSAKLNDTAAVIDQLRYIRDSYLSRPNFLRYRGKPVIFFWRPAAIGGSGAASVAAWQAIRAAVDPNHEQIWSAETTEVSFLDAFDGIHLFSAAKWAPPDQLAATQLRFRKAIDAYNAAHGTDRIWAGGAAPGYDDHRLPNRVDPVIPRADGAYYRTSLNAALASNPEWLTITSFNEWYEGTQIEPARSYGNLYLDLTRDAIAAWKGNANPCDGGAFFKETGYTICKAMAGYWQQYGGLAQFGFPIGPAHGEKAADGNTYTVQYFERARFELHPENVGTPYEVMLGQLGRIFHQQDAQTAPLTDGTAQYFPATGHNVAGLFLRYWQEHGGLFVNGYPLTEEISETLDGKAYRVQYFERTRLELHPENAGTPFEILLGALGSAALATSH